MEAQHLMQNVNHAPRVATAFLERSMLARRAISVFDHIDLNNLIINHKLSKHSKQTYHKRIGRGHH